jgi:hypothetical protein
MAWGSSSGDSPDRTMADLFAGMAVALLVVLVSLWLQALSDAQQIHKLKRLRNIFDSAFGHLGENDQDIQVDKKRGEITLRAEQAFESAEWTFSPQGEQQAVFERARTKLAAVLDDIERGFRDNPEAREYDPKEHVEILVIGHTDCRRFHRPRDGLQDNWDLSVLRAAALARFFTEPCQGGMSSCCPDGTQNCSLQDKGKRLGRDWRVLPAGRSQYEPRVDAPGRAIPVDETCDMSADETWLAAQRRVVIQVVPRLDKLMVRD